MPIVANVVEKGAFERLYRESPKWVHGKGGRHTNATVRVVSSTLQDASAKQDVRRMQDAPGLAWFMGWRALHCMQIIIPAPALKAASKFGKTLVSVKDRLAADFFHPLPAFDTSLTSSGNRKESLGSRPDPSTLSVINPTPTHVWCQP